MIEYAESRKPVTDLEPMQGVELVYFVIPEAALWSVVHVLFILERPLDVDVLKNRVQHGYGRFERLRQIPVRKGKPFYWETVEATNLDDHFKIVPAGQADTQEQLQAWLSTILTTPLDPRRPLWEVHYVPRYEDGAAVVLRIHHAYGDGRSLQTIATSMLGTSAEASRELLSASAPTVRNKAVADSLRPRTRRPPSAEPESFLQRVLRTLKMTLRAFKKTLSSFRKDHDTGFDDVPSATKSVAYSRPLSRASLRASAGQMQCTLNDLVLSGITGALRDNLIRHGKSPDHTRLTVSIPVDLHSPRSIAEMHTKGILTNHLGTLTIQLPIGVADGIERARLVARAITESLESGEPLMQYKSLSSFHRMPQGLLRRMFRSQAHKLSGIISNLPGPKEPYYLAGEKITGWVFWVIAAELAGSHVGVSVTHYQNDIRLGLTLPVNTGYDAGALLDAMVSEIEALAARAAQSSSAANVLVKA